MTRDPEIGLGHSRFWFVENHKFSEPAIEHDAGYDAVYMWKNNLNFTFENPFTVKLIQKNGQKYHDLVKKQYERLSRYYLNHKKFLEVIDTEFYNHCLLKSENRLLYKTQAKIFYGIVISFRTLFR